MHSTVDGTDIVTHPGGQEFPATMATPARLAELLRPEVVCHPNGDGYVDTLPTQDVAPPGRAQAAWQTHWGSVVYQRILQPMMASLWAPGAHTVATQLGLEPGHTVADVGCGPGNVTQGLADAVGPHGLAVGVDLSAPMLKRASNQARPNMGLVRGDATRLPLLDASVDAACATAVIMLVPEPAQALAELVRVTKPGGTVLVMVPARPAGATASLTRPVSELFTRIGGVRLFDTEDVAILLEQLGCDRIHTHQQATILTVRARTPATPRSSRPDSATEPASADFDAIYRGDYHAFSPAAPDQGTELDRVPWDIGEAQPMVRQLESAGRITSEVLDIGCGTGDNALFLAEHGYRVCGLDGAPAAIDTARDRARQRGLQDTVEFAVADATTLPGYRDRFATVLDSALYHCLTHEQRHAYVAALHRACQSGAQLHLLCFSEQVPDDFPGPYRITEDNLRNTLPPAGWEIERLERTTYTTAFTRTDLDKQHPHGLPEALAGTSLDYDEHERLLVPVWLVTATRR